MVIDSMCKVKNALPSAANVVVFVVAGGLLGSIITQVFLPGADWQSCVLMLGCYRRQSGELGLHVCIRSHAGSRGIMQGSFREREEDVRLDSRRAYEEASDETYVGRRS